MDRERESYRLLKQCAIANGLSLFGVADMAKFEGKVHQLPSDLVAELKYAISLGVRLSDLALEGIKDDPTPLYSWHYRQANILLDRVASQLVNSIQEKGYNALPIPASQTIDWQRQIGHLSHKHVGSLAGHGWIGRNNLLVNPRFGARVRYATILTDMPLPVDGPIDSGCGSCNACIGVCPAEALGEAAEDYDFERCFQKLSFFRKRQNIGHYICGICVKACKGFREGLEGERQERKDEATERAIGYRSSVYR